MAGMTAGCQGTHSNKSGYVTIDQLAVLPPNTRVVVDMSAIFNRKCNIYTEAFIVCEGVDSHGRSINVSKMIGDQWYRKAFASCYSANSDELFNTMIIGGDKELKNWRLFCADCLLIATHRYLVYKQPFPVKLESNPSISLAIRDRSRMTKFWPQYINKSGDDEPAGDRKDARPGRQVDVVDGPDLKHMSFNPEELGSEEPVKLDLSEYVCNGTHTFVKSAFKPVIMSQIQSIIKACQHGGSVVSLYQSWYEQLRRDCARYSKEYIRSQAAEAGTACMLLAILDRLMNGKPLVIIENTSRNMMSALKQPEAYQHHDPSINSGKGGYEVHGELVEGAGDMVVSLTFNDLKPSMVLFVDMTQELGVSTVIKTKHQDLMVMYQQWALSASGKSPESIKQAASRFRTACASFNPNICQLAKAGSADAARMWQEHQSMCLCLAVMQSGAYDKPIRLCYEPGCDTGLHDPMNATHATALRYLCLQRFI